MKAIVNYRFTTQFLEDRERIPNLQYNYALLATGIQGKYIWPNLK